MIEDWDRQALHARITQEEFVAFYLYTPMCGTCQLAGKILEVVALSEKDIIFGKANLNYVTSIAEDFKIESVPCLLLFHNGVVVRKIYAFQSVLYILERLSILKKST